MARRLEDVLAQRVRELASQKTLPISHVADRCGLAHSYFWRILTAKASATLGVVQRLADALEVDPIELLVASPVKAGAEGHRHDQERRPVVEPKASGKVHRRSAAGSGRDRKQKSGT